MKKSVKILLIISIILFILSIICGIGISAELIREFFKEDFNDEFSQVLAIFTFPLTIGMFFVPVIYVGFFIAFMWTIYGIIIQCIKLVKKQENKLNKKD